MALKSKKWKKIGKLSLSPFLARRPSPPPLFGPLGLPFSPSPSSCWPNPAASPANSLPLSSLLARGRKQPSKAWPAPSGLALSPLPRTAQLALSLSLSAQLPPSNSAGPRVPSAANSGWPSTTPPPCAAHLAFPRAGPASRPAQAEAARTRCLPSLWLTARPALFPTDALDPPVRVVPVLSCLSWTRP